MNIKETSISKRILWRYVNDKLKHSIHYFHIFGVITILFDELLEDLKSDKGINIVNFGIIKIKKTKPKKFQHLHSREYLMSKGRKLLYFKLYRNLKIKLYSLLDLDKTFGGD